MMGVLLGDMPFDVLQLIERVGLNWIGDTIRERSLRALTVSIPILINPFSPPRFPYSNTTAIHTTPVMASFSP